MSLDCSKPGIAGTTWALHCGACRREIAVDVIALVEGVADVRDFDSSATFARAKCRECGGRMKLTGGLQVAALKNTGHMPRLIVSDGRTSGRDHGTLSAGGGRSPCVC